jgi:hypothetical protein
LKADAKGIGFSVSNCLENTLKISYGRAMGGMRPAAAGSTKFE